MKKLFDNYGFVILDISLKIFFFLYIYQTSFMLSPSDFDKLSYFRNTVMMFVMVSTSSLGLYFLNYQREFYNCEKYHYSFIALPLIIFMILLAIMSITFYLFQDFFHLASFISSEGLLTILFIFGIVALAQLSIVMVKAFGNINKRLIVNFLIIIFISISLGAILIKLYAFQGSLYYFLLAYLMIFLVISKSIKIFTINTKIKLDFQFMKNKLKVFIIPNFFESLLSIIAPWLMLFFLIKNHGFEGIGNILFYQALLGLTVFLAYSLIMNQFGSLEKSFDSIKKFNFVAEKKFFRVAFVLIPVFGLFSNELKYIFNLTNIDNYNLVFLFIGTIFQLQITVTTMGFKRLDMSSRTLYQNFIYSMTLIITSFVCTYYFKIYGYGLSFFISWFLVYMLIMRDIFRILVIPIWSFVMNAFILICLFLFTFYVSKFLDMLLYKAIITTVFMSFIFLFYKRNKNVI